MERSFRRAVRGAAALRKADELVERTKTHEQEMADHRVQDVEDWIRIVTTRTRSIELLRRFATDPEVAAFLEEVK